LRGFGSTSNQYIGIAYIVRFNLHLSPPRRLGDELFLFLDKLREAVRLLCTEQGKMFNSNQQAAALPG
jgi:hypothetical protein